MAERAVSFAPTAPIKSGRFCSSALERLDLARSLLSGGQNQAARPARILALRARGSIRHPVAQIGHVWPHELGIKCLIHYSPPRGRHFQVCFPTEAQFYLLHA